MSGNIPDGWRHASLGDVLRLEYGRALSATVREDGDVPVYGSNGMVGLHSTPLVRRKGIVVGRKGTAGSVSVTDGPFWPIDTAYYVEPRVEVDFDWLASVLKHARLSDLNESTGVPGLNRDKVYREAALIPPLDEQRRIAEVLRSADDALEAQAAVRDQLEVTFSQLVHECFSCDWPRVALGEVCESIQVGIVVRPASYYVSEGGIPALRSLNVGENWLDLENLVYISDQGHKLNGKSSLRPGDVVTRRTGEPGKSAVIPPGFPKGLNCIDIIFSRPKEVLRPEFLSFFMNSDVAKRQVLGMQGGLAQQHLNVGEMKKIKVPMPPLNDQDHVVLTLSDVWRQFQVEGEAVRGQASLKNALAADLLSGRVRVPA